MHCRWMIWNQLNAKSVTLLHEYMHKESLRHSSVAHHRDAQMVNESVIDDALLQAMPRIKHMLTILWRYEILFGILVVTFLIKYCSLVASDVDC